MFQILLENIPLTIIIISLIFVSIALQILIGIIYQKLINEAENLSTTENKYLKICILKFQKCYQLNGNVPNISVFVDKFINRLVLFGMSLNSLRRLASQLVMLAVFVAGVGTSLSIIAGETILSLLPYYILAIVGLYIYFSIAALVDIPGCRETLKINLMDQLENYLLSRLRNNTPSEAQSTARVFSHKNAAVTDANEDLSKPALEFEFSEDEIEELLQEFIS